MEIFFINSFTSEKFKGNPTAVCLTDKKLNADTASSLAKEFNLPVTAFVEFGQHQNIFPIRYFTPTQEIPACGHATLASVKAVVDRFSIDAPSFKTIENIILHTHIRDNVITMTYPKYQLRDCSISNTLLQCLKIPAYRSAGICAELEALFIELDDPTLLKSIQPDFEKLVASNDKIIEVVITSLSGDNNYDFILRAFCPWIGINEDPATGSVHSVLADFWKTRLDKTNFKAYQASQRGGEVFVTALRDKVQIGGRATVVSMKEILLDR